MRRLLLLTLIATGCSRSVVMSSGSTPPADSIDLIVAGTTDTHGWLRGWDYYSNAVDSTRGLSRLATIVDSLRSANPGRVILVDAGDDLQGTPITSVALRDTNTPSPIIAAMNAMRYDAGVIGNHEFNYGVPYLDRSIGQAKFPFLAANAFTTSGQRAYPSSTIVERSGVKVGIVGATTPGSMVWDRDKLAGRIVMRDIVPVVRAEVAAVRARGADVIVVVLHSGLTGTSSYDTVGTDMPSENVSARVALEVADIDLVVFGHTHRELADTMIGTALLNQPRNGAGSLSVARLTVTRSGGRWHVASKTSRVIQARGHAEQAAVVTATEASHVKAIAYARAPIGSTPVAWHSDSARVLDVPIIDFILDVERRTAGTDLASTSAFTLNASFGPGPITMADISQLYPYENNVLRAVRITGKQLRDYLEFSARYFRQSTNADSLVDFRVPGFNFDIVSGVDYTIDLTKPVGARITSLTRGGVPVSDTATFTMALNDYRQSGGGGYTMLRGAPLIYDRQQSIRQLLVDEVQRKATIRPEDYSVVNWHIAPDSLVGAAYRSMRRSAFDRPRAP